MAAQLFVSRPSDTVREFRFVSSQSRLLGVQDLVLLIAGFAAFALLYGSSYFGLGWLWLAGSFFFWLRTKLKAIKEESLMVVQDLGVQVKTHYFLGYSTQQFIDRSRIADIIINEGITMQAIVFYLAIIVHNQDRMVVVFENTLPRLNALLRVFREARAVLFKEPL